MNDKTVVITGGGGYIGSVLSPLVAEAGYQVRVLDRLRCPSRTLRPTSSFPLMPSLAPTFR